MDASTAVHSVARWAVTRDVKMAGYLVVRLAGYSVASMDETTAGRMDASTVVRLVDLMDA